MIDRAEMRDVAWRVPPQPQSAVVLPDWILPHFFHGALAFSKDGAHCLDGGWTARPGDWIVRNPADINGKPSETIRMISADDVMMGWRIAEYCSHLNAAPEAKPVTKYRANPEVFEAHQLQGPAILDDLPAWLADAQAKGRVITASHGYNQEAAVHTGTGMAYAVAGDWIVMSKDRALSVVSAEDFARLYSPIEEA